MTDIQAQAIISFREHFSSEPESTFFAPGRVNLIGEHTDYNDGFVLPCAIGYGTYLLIRERADHCIRVVAGNFSDSISQWPTDQPVERDSQQTWSNYLRGVSAHFYDQGIVLGGMDIYVVGNVPRGAGLSSSASFSVAFATACNELNKLNLDKREIARICQQAERDFAGCNCGIMDQLASVAGEQGRALLLDCRSLQLTTVAIPEALELMIIDSKVERSLVGSEYNDRRCDCERAASIMGLASLRDASLDMLEYYRSQLDDTAYRRARHVLSENERTLKAAEALAQNNYAQLHQLMAESHLSMRDDFEITVPEIDFLVESVEQLLEADGGVRMTGGGFGGCVIALVPRTKCDSISRHVQRAYLKGFQRHAEIHICHASAGARRLGKLRATQQSR